MPRLLDLFCGAGGAGMGYHLAGFDVVGVDINRQPRYPFEFHRGDALEYLAACGEAFDFVHASPPCQAYSRLRHRTGKAYPDLVAPTRRALEGAGLPYVIENVPEAPLRDPVLLCGAAFDLGVHMDTWRGLVRHRAFESSRPLAGTGCRCTGGPTVTVTGTGGSYLNTGVRGGCKGRKADSSAAMGIDWMTIAELSQAIPPAYTQFIGEQLLADVPKEVTE